VTEVDESLLTAIVGLDSNDLYGLTEALCSVPSVWPGEGPLADAIERRLRARTTRLEIRRVGNNVVARTQFGADRRVVFGGHLDTVPPNDNQRPRRDGDVLHGLGAADMKGSLAVLLALAEAVDHRDARFDMTLFWYEGEEVADEHNGLRHLFETMPALLSGDLAVLCEPTGGWVEAGCQGTVHVRAGYLGERAHSARPWTGQNAIAKAAPALARVAAFSPVAVEVDGLEFRQALQLVRVEGGVANNVVPDRCSFVLNRRFAPCFTVADAVTQTLELLDDADETEVLNASPGAPPNLSDPLVAEFVGTLDLPVRPKLGWTDVARFAARGIAALNYGAGEPAVAHTKDERVERSDLERCRRVLGAFCGID